MHLPPPEIDPNRPNAELLRWAYSNGIFPMGDHETGEVEWFRPDPRAILPLDRFHVPKNLSREVRKKKFTIRSDTSFEQVIRACAPARSFLNQQWITDRLVPAYLELFELGHAHCVEAWLGNNLVGGLYGVHLGSAFFGESMFARPDLGGTNASKVCLVQLVRWLNHRGFMLLDTQFRNPHLDQFGCVEIPRAEYHRRLEAALARNCTWGAFVALEK